jgi:hypothetical protein
MKNLKERKNIFKCSVVREDEYILRVRDAAEGWFFGDIGIIMRLCMVMVESTLSLSLCLLSMWK